MVKPIKQENSLTDNDFFYEVDNYKITKNSACLLSSKIYKTSKKISKEIFIKKYNNYNIISFIKLL